MRMNFAIIAIMSAASIASAQQAAPLDSRMAEVYLEYANLVGSAYATSGRPKDSVGNLKLATNGFTDLSSTSGFRAATYVDQESRRVVVAFAGTEPQPLINPSGFVRDIATGAIIRVGATPAQIRQVELLIEGIQKQNPGVQIVVAGHSLGGALAQYVAAKYGLEGYTFNSEVLGSALSAQAMQGKTQLAKPIVHIVEKGELLSQTVNRVSTVGYLGGNVTVVDYTRQFLTGGDHSLTNLIAGLGYNAFGTLGAAPVPVAAVRTSFSALSQPTITATNTANSTPQTAINSNISQSGTYTALANVGTQAANFSGALAYATAAGSLELNTATGNAWKTSGGNLLSWDFASRGGVGKGNLNGAQIVDAGSSATAEGPIYWGRWLGNTTQITSNAGTQSFGAGVNYVYGSPAISLPQNQQFTYSLVGGTPIVSASGVVGLPLQSGTITVNTAAQTVKPNNLVFGFSAGSAFGAATFTNPISSAVTYSSTLAFSGTMIGLCTGGVCAVGNGVNQLTTGKFSGQFTGASGTGIALVFSAATINNGTATAAGSAAFKR